MTKVYFIRHCQPDHTVHEDRERPLTIKGQRDGRLLAELFKDKEIHAVLSSPYRRAVDTVKESARTHGLFSVAVEDFRERKVGDWVQDFSGFSRKQWENFSYKLPGGESLFEVQKRNLSALEETLDKYPEKTIMIGTHGTALSTILHHYQPKFDFLEFEKIRDLMPWIAEADFAGKSCVSIISYDLFRRKEERII